MKKKKQNSPLAVAGDRLSPLSGPVVPWLAAVDTAVARVVTVTDGDATDDDDDGFTGELLPEVLRGGDCDGPGLGAAIGVGVVVPGVVPLWWFSVCRRSDRASQYDLPQPSALHSYGFLFRCVSMWPLLWGKESRKGKKIQSVEGVCVRMNAISGLSKTS